jgi:hypothetical protein
MTRYDPDQLRAQKEAEFSAVWNVLGDAGLAEFETAGELAALMAALPPQTPVCVAEIARIDPGLDVGETPDCTAAATMITVVETEDLVELVGDDGAVSDLGRLVEGEGNGRRLLEPYVPGVELGAFIVAEGGRVPEGTRAVPLHERAVEALADGELDVALQAQCELLAWMAGTLAPDTIDRDTFPDWIEDGDLRAQLAVEGERLRQAAARLRALGAEVAAITPSAGAGASE